MTAKTPIPEANLDYLQFKLDHSQMDTIGIDRKAIEDVIAELKLRRASKTAVKKPQSAKTKRKFAEADRRGAARRSVVKLCERSGCRHARIEHRSGEDTSCCVEGCWCNAWREDFSVE